MSLHTLPGRGKELKVCYGVNDSYRKGDSNLQADFCKNGGSGKSNLKGVRVMKKNEKKYRGKVISNIIKGIIVAGVVLALSIPMTALGAVEKDNSFASPWHNGMISAAEKDVRNNNPEEGNQTFLSRMFFSEEKNVYDIIKKMFQSEDKMYSSK